MMNRTFLICCCFLTHAITSVAQESPIPYQVLPLQKLSEFQPTSSNWQLVQDVYFDLEGGKINTSDGTGILLNTLKKEDNQAIKTSFEHGDIELMLDFMMPKGSNSGIFLQGRYEIQLADSWVEQNPTAADAGSINHRWDPKRGQGRESFEGHPPFLNVSKAPGLWQSLKVSYTAPRFDSQGKKLANAKFNSVHQNGILVQNNIEVTGPTQGSFFEEEMELGPLIIQGDQGGIAIRNISYKTYGSKKVKLSDMKLTYYDSIQTITDFANASPKGVMKIAVLSHEAPASKNEFAGIIEGILTVPSAGEYFFTLNLSWIADDNPNGLINGAGIIYIDDKQVVDLNGLASNSNGSVQLTPGAHKFKMKYYKAYDLWYARNNDITLLVEGKGIARTILNEPLRPSNSAGQISVKVTDRTAMQRGFIMHHDEKRTHTLAVGSQEGLNYAIDLSKGQLLNVWRGDFVETTPMWHGRGETQLMLPLGNVIEFGNKPSLAILSTKESPWPDQFEDLTFEGYELKNDGTPIIKYALPELKIRDVYEARDFGKKLVHTITLEAENENQQIYCLVAQGVTIEKLPNGLYAIDDKSYYIEFEGKESPILRSSANGSKELVLPVKLKDKAGTISYSIDW